MAPSSRRLFDRGCRALMAATKSSSARTTFTAGGGAAATKVKKATPIPKPPPITPALGNFLGGVSKISRAETVKKILFYIKLRNLQNPANKKEIFCDAKLKTIFGKDQIGKMEVAKLVNPHFVKASRGSN